MPNNHKDSVQRADQNGGRDTKDSKDSEEQFEHAVCAGLRPNEAVEKPAQRPKQSYFGGGLPLPQVEIVEYRSF